MSISDFDRVQRVVLAGAAPDEVLKLLPAGSRLVFDAPCPTCHTDTSARRPN